MSDPLLDQGIDSLKNVLVLIDVLCRLHLPVCCADGIEGLSQKADPEESRLAAKSLLQSFSGQDVK